MNMSKSGTLVSDKETSDRYTLTEFMYKLICELVSHDLDSEERATLPPNRQVQLDKLPDTAEATFNVICELAMEHLLQGHKCVDLDESLQFLSSFLLQQANVSSNEIFRFCLVDTSSDIDPTRYVYEFLDPVMTEFLAAFHLYKQPPLNQLYFLYKNALALFKNGFTRWLRFFFGLIGRNSVSDMTQQNPTKLMMNTVIDVLVHSLELNQESEYRYHLIECIHELQEKSLFRKLASKHPAVLSLSIQGGFDTCISPVSTLISKSGFAEWTVSTCSSNEHSVAKLKEEVRGVSIVVKINNLVGAMVSLIPTRTPAETAKMYRDIDSSKLTQSGKEKAEKFNQYCCRAVREILQRIFPIYSEVKIKGDASNVSYVSFLTCDCFKKSFQKHVKLFPLQPVHFLSGPKRDLSKLPPESLTTTDRHNLLKHNGESMEVVIMLRPLLQKVEGIVPMNGEEFSLVLSHNLILNFSDESELVAVVRCFDDYKVDSTHTKQILLVLPIVQKTIYGCSQMAYPRPFLPPPHAPKVDTGLQLLENYLHPLPPPPQGPDPFLSPPHEPKVDTQLQLWPTGVMPVHVTYVPSLRSPHLLDQHRHSRAQALMPSSIQPSQGVFVQNVEQAVGEVRVHPATARRQTALRPGTMLYTSMPEKLPSDRIQPLPLQRTLIRKGGNGSIFSENVGGTAMAVKKTSYRSKEYSIITKIRHKNIVPLLAYVWGEEHRENKRRYYVYHYLPKLSGDLARLVTDKEELSLYEFNKINQYMDFKAVGVAVGNSKYTLSQVLQGLQYLHNIHIAHSDLKASNVLIKFFCACPSPIVCGCEVKYQVVLCDFNAATQLDSQDCVPITSSPYIRAKIVPVGTNGFRSPESSMLTIANTPEAFSPPLTTKTDIYSFGILCMRLMISTDTPYSQRTMATLLLHYHQMKGLSEGRMGPRLSRFHRLDEKTTQLLTGRRWLNFLKVPEDKVHKILKLSKLRPRMAWLKKGFDFVSQCLSVDPEARPSASDLLKDPFLT